MRVSLSIDVCPKASIMGKNQSGLIEDPNGFTTPHFVFLNGGASRIWAFATVYNPALVQWPMRFELRKPRGTSAEVTFRVPAILRIVAGVPLELTHWPFVVGGRSYAPGYVTFDRRCPRRHPLRFEASLTYLNPDGSSAEVTRRVSATCRSDRSLDADDEGFAIAH